MLQSTTSSGYTINTVNNFFGSTRTQELVWTGARYALPSGWNFGVGYYHMTQDDFLNGAGKNCANGTKAAVGIATPSNCAGNIDSVSFMADYQINKYFDVYAGVQFSEASGGFANGFLNDNQTTVVTGTRLKF